METIVLIWLLSALLGAAMLSKYNKAGTGFLLGLILGVFGLLFCLLIRAGEKAKVEKQRHDEQMEALKSVGAAAPAMQSPPSGEQRECPFCAEMIMAKARVCKHCQRDVQPVAA